MKIINRRDRIVASAVNRKYRVPGSNPGLDRFLAWILTTPLTNVWRKSPNITSSSIVVTIKIKRSADRDGTW
jgi:hypothetical protein